MTEIASSIGAKTVSFVSFPGEISSCRARNVAMITKPLESNKLEADSKMLKQFTGLDLTGERGAELGIGIEIESIDSAGDVTIEGDDGGVMIGGEKNSSEL